MNLHGHRAGVRVAQMIEHASALGRSLGGRAKRDLRGGLGHADIDHAGGLGVGQVDMQFPIVAGTDQIDIVADHNAVQMLRGQREDAAIEHARPRPLHQGRIDSLPHHLAVGIGGLFLLHDPGRLGLLPGVLAEGHNIVGLELGLAHLLGVEKDRLPRLAHRGPIHGLPKGEEERRGAARQPQLERAFQLPRPVVEVVAIQQDAGAKPIDPHVGLHPAQRQFFGIANHQSRGIGY